MRYLPPKRQSVKVKVRTRSLLETLAEVPMAQARPTIAFLRDRRHSPSISLTGTAEDRTHHNVHRGPTRRLDM
jgi:hypothetical protein